MRGIYIYHTEEAHSVNRYLLSTYCVPGTVLVYKHTAADWTVRSLTSHSPQACFHCSQMCSVVMVGASSDQAAVKMKLLPR